MILQLSRIVITILLLIWPTQALCLTGQVNINNANQQQLQELPYIGEHRARDIIEYRDQYGPFRNLNDLLKVKTIGQKSLDAIRPYLTLTATTTIISKPAPSSFHRKFRTKAGDIVTLPDDQYYHTLIDHIKKAEHSIYISMFLFKTTSSPKNKAALLVKELIKARKNRVKIQVILENSSYSESINEENRKVAAKLQKNKIKVIFDSPNTTTHTKIIVIDKRYSFVGSHNFSHSALSLNHEFSVLIDNKNIADELTSYMEAIENY